MVRSVDHDQRRRSVLSAAIDRYIERAVPVASDELVEEFDLSSATIRNILAELEESGYLRQQHTSGGRIPTDKGYRYYVDFLVSQMELLDEEKESICREYDIRTAGLEDLLDKTSEVISAITSYAGIVSVDDPGGRFYYRGISRVLEQPEFRDVEKIRLLFRLIEEKERFLEIINRDFPEKVKVYIGPELDCPDLSTCSLVISNYRLKDRPLGRLVVLGPTRMQYNHIIPALEYISTVVTQALDNI